MLAIKIEANGQVPDLGKSNTCMNVTTSKDSFNDVLGKALYSIETQGYQFKTADVYDKAVKNFEDLSLRSSFQKIYSNADISVSVKLA